MAKRKRSSTSKRRRVGARSGLNLNSPVVKLALVGASYLLAADPVNTAVDKQAANIFKKKAGADGVVPAGVSDTGQTVMIGAGAVGSYLLLMKGRSSLPKTIAGAIIAGATLKRGLKKAGVISGYGVNGYQSVPVIGSYQNVPVIGARGNQNRINGYNVNGRNQSVMGSVMDRGVTSGSELLGG